MDVSKRIIQLREARGFSTNRLANKAGISQSYLREIEMGKKNPTIEVLSYVCEALDISLKIFFTPEEERTHPFLQSALDKLDVDEQIKLAEFINQIKK